MPDSPYTIRPAPLEQTIELITSVEQEKLDRALNELAAEDSSFSFSTEPGNGRTVLKGVSEDHLDAKCNMLSEIYGLGLSIGAPRVAYREIPTTRARYEYTHKTIGVPEAEFAVVDIAIEPTSPGSGCRFTQRIAAGTIPDQFIPGVMRGVERALAAGPVAGLKVTDVAVELAGGRFHERDSSVGSFEIAAYAAVRAALRAADPVLVEPIMRLEVTAPRDCGDAIWHDLDTRRARVEDMHGALSHSESGDLTIRAMVPLMNMFGYRNVLRAMTQARASFTLDFDHYARAPIVDPPPFRPAIGKRA